MKYSVMLLLFATCFFQNKKAIIVVMNESKIAFDSLHIKLNNYTYKVDQFLPGCTYKYEVSKDSVIAKHDVVFYFKAFVKDSIIIKTGIFSNDLGYIPDSTKLKITDSLKVVSFL